MGRHHMHLALHSHGPTPAERLVLIALAEIATPEGKTFRTVESVAQVAELSVRSVKRHIAALHRHGLVSRHDGAGRTLNLGASPQ